jgi:hypothetical protein
MNPPRSERAILGVAFVYNNYLTVSPPAPYRVEMANHPLFQGTGLNNGDLIGQTGLNGPASGWELDVSDSAETPAGQIVNAWYPYGNMSNLTDRGTAPSNLQVLARGTNQSIQGPVSAHMTFYETTAGGFVFSVGSLCFTGSLVQDENLQAIVRNALSQAGVSPSN